MRCILSFLIFLPALSWAVPKKLTTVIDDTSAQAVGPYGSGTDCYSKQQALQLQLKVCRNHQTLTSCLDQFYLPVKKKFPNCAEESSAACLDACVEGMTYSYCTKYCK